MNQMPEPVQHLYAPVEQPLPAHHRPPNVMYTPDGVPYHFTVGQPPAPQTITVQLPEQSSMSPAQREFMMYVIMWLAVAVILVACVCAVVVIAGGTLMGIIGTVGQNAIPMGMAAVGIIVAAGWAAARIKALMPAEKASKKK